MNASLQRDIEEVEWVMAERTDDEPWAAWQRIRARLTPDRETAPANVTPLRQPRLDLARLADAISAAVYDNAKGLSVTEAIGALELAKLELLREQEQ